MSDPNDYVDIYRRAEEVFQLFGKRAPMPLFDTSTLQYRQQLLQELEPHVEPQYRGLEPGKIRDVKALATVEKLMMDSAIRESKKPVGPPRAVVSTDLTGRKITSYVGADDAYWSQFTTHPDVIRAGRINTSLFTGRNAPGVRAVKW
jgi:hypothetical protein